MKCPHCNGLMQDDHDRKHCLLCGRSFWKNFQMRKGVSDASERGRGIGHNRSQP